MESVKFECTLMHAKCIHQENDTLSDLSDLSWHRHLRQNKTDLINLIKAMYLSTQEPDACHKAIRQPKTLTQCSLTPGIIS
jgi:ubiquitin C-terminal hydrolase